PAERSDEGATKGGQPGHEPDRRRETLAMPDDRLDDERLVWPAHLAREEGDAIDREDPADRRVAEDAAQRPVGQWQDASGGHDRWPDLGGPEPDDRGGRDRQTGRDPEDRRQRPAEAVDEPAAEERPDREPDRARRPEDRDHRADPPARDDVA